MSTPAARKDGQPRSRGWIAFFVVLACLAAAAVTLPIIYNLGQQLRPEQLEAARQRWHERGPADYDLTFSIHLDRERLPERHVVLVRQGQVVFASCEGDVRRIAPPLAALVGLPLGGAGEDRALDVPAILDHIETLLHEESHAARANFLVAVFDPHNGYPRRFIRRVRGTSTREEWNLRLWQPGELERIVKR